MGDIVNLNKARKSKARSDHEQTAAENRRKFGRTKSARKVEDLEKSKQAKELDGLVIDADK